MPYLVRDRLFIGDISDAAEILQKGSTEFTHILSLLSSASISFFTEWRSSIIIPAKEIRKVFVVGSEGASSSEDDVDNGLKKSSPPEKLLYSLEYAGKDLKFVRMATPLRDMENEDLLDYLDVCLDFIHENRKEGAVLVHCFAGVSRSAAIITAYLMRTEQLSQEGSSKSIMFLVYYLLHRYLAIGLQLFFNRCCFLIYQKKKMLFSLWYGLETLDN
uniref:protein-tyrosine-phosphatase n=1 Tax=Nelumbo nucifera TaxID=4432 RepID=A0A822Z982_NELNU|nr:TPA_asm: hypothetical protein HUJ06_001084 [Nelumbo nucifera]